MQLPTYKITKSVGPATQDMFQFFSERSRNAVINFTALAQKSLFKGSPLLLALLNKTPPAPWPPRFATRFGVERKARRRARDFVNFGGLISMFPFSARYTPENPSYIKIAENFFRFMDRYPRPRQTRTAKEHSPKKELASKKTLELGSLEFFLRVARK